MGKAIFNIFIARLAAKSPVRESSLWQTRLFNPNVPNDAEVLGFTPEWKKAIVTLKAGDAIEFFQSH